MGAAVGVEASAGLILNVGVNATDIGRIRRPIVWIEDRQGLVSSCVPGDWPAPYRGGRGLLLSSWGRLRHPLGDGGGISPATNLKIIGASDQVHVATRATGKGEAATAALLRGLHPQTSAQTLEMVDVFFYVIRVRGASVLTVSGISVALLPFPGDNAPSRHSRVSPSGDTSGGSHRHAGRD
jgi:hypothetical protein